MNKVVLIPDSFKGTMSSVKICELMEKVVHDYYPLAEVTSIPVADGGEGSVDCFLHAVGGKRVEMEVKGPYFENMKAFYGILPDNTAVIEMSACAGLPLVGDNKNPGLTTTFGVGQLMLHAVHNGCKKILIGLGGSATNDAGVGAAAAVGVKFFDKNNNEFIPTGNTLKEIYLIDTTNIDKKLKSVEITTMCDIDNPLCGENGAAYVFARQKGADDMMIKNLDEGLSHLSDIIKKDINLEVKEIDGAGAAGGMGAGMVAFFSSELRMGIEAVLDIVNFESLIQGTDLIFTGEGMIDNQSLRGKVVVGVARRAKKVGVPVLAIVGDVGDGIEPIYDMGVNAIFSINRKAIPFSEAKLRSEQDLKDTMSDIIKTIKVFDN